MASLGLAAAAGTCIALGVPLAWLLTRTAIPGGRLWLIIGRTSACGSVLRGGLRGWPPPVAAGLCPAWAVLSLGGAFRMVLPVAAVLSQVDPAFDEVARTLWRRTVAVLPSHDRPCCGRLPRPVGCFPPCTRSATSGRSRCCGSTRSRG